MNPISLSWFNQTGAPYNGVANNAWSPATPLGTLGYSQAQLKFVSRATSSLTLTNPGKNPSAAADIPYLAPVKFTGAFAGMNSGAPVVFFAGRRTDNRRKADPGRPSVTLIFTDAWDDLEKTPFQQTWQMRSPTDGAVTTYYSSRVNLFQDISGGPTLAWVYKQAQAQLQEIITYARVNCGLPLQAGTIDPNPQAPIFGTKGVSCAEAINLILKTCPDCFTYFDYTTTPPTLHIRQRSALTPLTLSFAGTDAQGRHHQSSDLQDLPELIPSCVVFQYQQTNTVNGQSWNYSATDAFPLLSTGAQRDAIVIPIDLRGGVQNNVSAVLNSEAIDPTTTAFWKKFKPDIGIGTDVTLDASTPILDTTINGGSGHPQGITIKDESGTNVSLAGLNLLDPGSTVAAWMYLADGVTPVSSKSVVITGYLKYARKSQPLAPGTAIVILDNVANHAVAIRCKLTNSPAGAQSYATVASSSSPEPAVTGLAQYIYEALSVLQWQGQHTLVEDSVHSLITPAYVLNLGGGAAEWAAMNATIYETNVDLFSGRTQIRLGPHKHLSVNEVESLKELWTWRIVYENPQARNTGQSFAGGGQADLGKDQHRENTESGRPILSLSTAIGALTDGSATIVQHDPNTNGGQIVLNNQQDNGAGAAVIDATKPQVQLSQDDLYADTMAKTGRLIAKWRKVTLPDGTVIRVAATDDFSTGGGNTTALMKVTADPGAANALSGTTYNDISLQYVTAVTGRFTGVNDGNGDPVFEQGYYTAGVFTASTDASLTQFNVAKPCALRRLPFTPYLFDSLHNFTPAFIHPAYVQTRVPYLQPPVGTSLSAAAVPQYIWAESHPEGTGVIDPADGSKQLVWLDINVDGRQWGYPKPVCINGVPLLQVFVASEPYIPPGGAGTY